MATSVYKPSKCELNCKFKKAKHVIHILQLFKPLLKHTQKWWHYIKIIQTRIEFF